MKTWILVLAGLALATVALPAASASGCSLLGGVATCDVQAAGYASADVTVDYRYWPVEAEGSYCVDSNSHPGFEECQRWETA